MRYYEITAERGKSKIVERFMEGGVRYVKYVPFNPKIFVTIKDQFASKPNIKVDLVNGWVKITKTAPDKELEERMKGVVGEEATMDKLIDMEVKMLKQAGYKVSVVEGEYEESS